jgi:hypothetical protein
MSLNPNRLADATGHGHALSAEEREKILSLGANLQNLWNDPSAPLELKKRIIRTAIREILVRIDNEGGHVKLTIHWAGGAHTELIVAKNKLGRNKNAASEETVDLIRELARGWPDRYIAQMLNRIGSRTGPGNGWSETRVKTFRNQHKIDVFPLGKTRPWLTMEESAETLGVSAAVVRTMVKHGKLCARQIAGGLPWMIERSELERPEVKSRVRQIKLGLRSPREDKGQTVMSCI